MASPSTCCPCRSSEGATSICSLDHNRFTYRSDPRKPADACTALSRNYSETVAHGTSRRGLSPANSLAVKANVVTYLEDSGVTDTLDRQLRGLLSACFTDPCFAGQRYCHEMPQHRWIITDGDGEPAAHLAAHDKMIGSSTGDLRVLGIAEVCVREDFRGRGLVRKMIEVSHAWACTQEFPYAMLFGMPAYYSSSGYICIKNPIRRFEPKREEWETTRMDSAMVCPIHSPPPWPPGEIDIRGPLF